MSLYQVLNKANIKVAEVFQKLTQNCDKEKIEKIVNYITTSQTKGKSLERSMADSLEIFKLDGAVNAGNDNV